MNRKPTFPYNQGAHRPNRWRLVREICGTILALASLALFLFALLRR